MQIRVGYELQYTFTQPTPIILTLNIHHSRAADLEKPDQMQTAPVIPTRANRDGFANFTGWCRDNGLHAMPAGPETVASYLAALAVFLFIVSVARQVVLFTFVIVTPQVAIPGSVT